MTALAFAPDPSPGSRCAVRGCNTTRGLRPYSLTLDGRVPPAWDRVAMCDVHRADADEVADTLEADGMPHPLARAVAVYWLSVSPDRTLMRRQKLQAQQVAVLEPRQLSFADQLGPQGEYWRGLF